MSEGKRKNKKEQENEDKINEKEMDRRKWTGDDGNEKGKTNKHGVMIIVMRHNKKKKR